MTQDETPLFFSAESAVRWALSDQRVALQQSSIYRSPGSGRGLAGFDGAAQAGMIMAHVQRLDWPAHPLLVAQATAVRLPCGCRRDCCSGWRSNAVWTEAVSHVAEWWLKTQDPGCRRPRLVIGCLRRFFGEHISLEAIGKRNGVSKAAAVELNGAVVKPLKPIKESAWREIEDKLMSVGIVEDKRPMAA